MTVAAGGTAGNPLGGAAFPAPESSGSPYHATIPHDQSVVPSPPVVPPNQSAILPNQPDAAPNVPDPAPGLTFGRSSDLLGAMTNHLNPATLVPPEGHISAGPHLSSPLVIEAQLVGAGRHSHVDVDLLNSAPSDGAANIHPPSNPLADVNDEPTWMKKRRTLDYFRSTFKLGNLSDVIEHWYELERLLCFQDVVSVPIYFFNASLSHS